MLGYKVHDALYLKALNDYQIEYRASALILYALNVLFVDLIPLSIWPGFRFLLLKEMGL